MKTTELVSPTVTLSIILNKCTQNKQDTTLSESFHLFISWVLNGIFDGDSLALLGCQLQPPFYIVLGIQLWVRGLGTRLLFGYVRLL